MLVPATGPLDASAEGLHALYVSINHPVVTLDRLPVGPATAAIAVHEDAGATLLIRSVRTGTVACFHAEPAADPRVGPARALSHAEGLGFLFTEEVALGASGLARSDWPVWLAEIFAAGLADLEADDPSTWLSKFRWAVLGQAAQRPTRAGGDRMNQEPNRRV